MGYRNEIYSKALNIKKSKVKAELEAYEAKVSSLRDKSPEFAELENELSSIGATLAITALSGNDEKIDRLKAICNKLNEKKSKLLKDAGIIKPAHLCKICGDDNYVAGKPCSCIEELAKQITFAELSDSLPLNESTFENFNLDFYSNDADSDGFVPKKRAAALLKLCNDFADNFPFVNHSLLFMGGVGLGKTHLSLAIVSKVAKKGYGVIYGSANNLFSAAEKEHFSYSGETEKVDALLNCDLLVIDDLGTEFLTSFTSSLIYNIINTRILNRKPTIINTNLNFDELESRYTSRITSRFIGHYEMKKFIGSDIRQIKALKQ